MRLLTWNAGRGQYAKKAPWLEHFQADVAVIQEIARPNTEVKGVCWHGVNPKQGVAVIARPPFAVVPHPEAEHAPKYFVPFRITGPVEFILFAVWTLGNQDERYIRAATAAIDIYGKVFESGPVVVMGDFNSNKIWDHEHPSHLNHSAMVEKLSARGIGSAYHEHRKVAHGQESEHTFYLYRNPQKGYHIDYCFLPRPWIERIKYVDIGSHAAWYKASDHTPVLVETEA